MAGAVIRRLSGLQCNWILVSFLFNNTNTNTHNFNIVLCLVDISKSIGTKNKHAHKRHNRAESGTWILSSKQVSVTSMKSGF